MRIEKTKFIVHEIDRKVLPSGQDLTTMFISYRTGNDQNKKYHRIKAEAWNDVAKKFDDVKIKDWINLHGRVVSDNYTKTDGSKVYGYKLSIFDRHEMESKND